MILDKIIKNKRKQLKKDFGGLDKDFFLKRMKNTNNHSFYNSLKINTSISIIAEIKKASPSKNVIREDFNVESIAKQYDENDIQCISVLTETKFFQGNNEYIQIVKKITDKPILRKDFIIDPLQIYESKFLGADAILLIASILEEKQINSYIKIAKSLKMDCLVEIHNINELKKVLRTDANIIGINNRDLKTFNVDINNTMELSKEIPKEYLIVSESGIKQREDLEKLEKNNINAVLIGEQFMKHENIGKQINKLRGLDDY